MSFQRLDVDIDLAGFDFDVADAVFHAAVLPPSLGADVNAVAITAAAGASAGTSGSSAGASGGKKDATTAGKYYKGMAVFTIVKGGAMYQAAVAGQKFKYKPTAK